MLAYLIRRMLWMVPTFIGILVINFGVLRLQGMTLSDELAMTGSAKSGDGGERKVEKAGAAVENLLSRFRRTGNDLPALINLRAFSTETGMRATLESLERKLGGEARESERNQREKDLWLYGRHAVLPLAAVLADPDQERLHGPASLALSLCALTSINVEDLDRLSKERRSYLLARNDELKRLRIDFDNTNAAGFRTNDAQSATKAAALVALVQRDVADFQTNWTQRLGSVVAETGFIDFLSRLATGRLYSSTRKEYVFTIIADRWQVTLWLNVAAIILAWGVSIPLGMWSARHEGSLADRTATSGLFLLWALPSFFIGTLLLHHFATSTGQGQEAWFPNKGLSSPGSYWLTPWDYLRDLLWHAALPLFVLTYGSFTALSRYMRANVLEQLSADYVRTARAKGCDETRVMYGHVQRNSLITMITLGSGLLASLFGGFVFVESIYVIPGLGTLLLDAAKQQDAPLLMGSTVISVLLLLVGILLADLLYAVADPRIGGRYD